MELTEKSNITHRIIPKIVLTLFLFIFCQPVFGQNYSTFKTASKRSMGVYNDATKAIMADNYEEATKLLTQLTAVDSKFIDAWILLGELYKEQGDFEKGKAALDKAISLDPDYSSKANFFLAECTWNLDEYNKCIEACERYLTFTDISKARKSEAEHYLMNSRFAIEAIKNPVPFNPQNLGDKVNSEMPEYLPSLTGDEKTIVFTRRTGGGRNLNEDFYSSSRNKEWSLAAPVGDVNSVYNEGAQSQTPDGNVMYYVVCDKPGGYGSCDIYYTKRKGNNWAEAKNVGAPVCTNAWETQP
jgi:tetratricopeptide (TPR) repeat protein